MTTSRKLCRSGAHCQPATLKEALDCLGHHSDITVRQMADRLGHVTEGTLGKQLSLYDDDNYPPLRNLVPLMNAASNDALIEYLARSVGGVFFRPMVSGADGEQLGRTVREFGELLQCHGITLADGRVTEAEAEEFDRQADDVIAAVAQLKLRVRERAASDAAGVRRTA
jgi:hypothetical protein